VSVASNNTFPGIQSCGTNNKQKHYRTVSVASESEAFLGNGSTDATEECPGSPPCQEIAIYYSLKATVEFYQKYKTRLLQMCEATVTQSTRTPHVTINTLTGELYPFVPHTYLEALNQACVNDLKDFTFSTKFIGYLSHLLPPTIAQAPVAKLAVSEEPEEDEEDAQYKRCFEQVLQHLRGFYL
jgi:hypothetical protein